MKMSSLSNQDYLSQPNLHEKGENEKRKEEEKNIQLKNGSHFRVTG